jgi:hypothetical protein
MYSFLSHHYYHYYYLLLMTKCVTNCRTCILYHEVGIFCHVILIFIIILVWKWLASFYELGIFLEVILKNDLFCLLILDVVYCFFRILMNCCNVVVMILKCYVIRVNYLHFNSFLGYDDEYVMILMISFLFYFYITILII